MKRTRQNNGTDKFKRNLVKLLNFMKEQKPDKEAITVVPDTTIMHMVKLLKSVKNIENPYSMQSLETYYRDFSKEKGETIFSIEELFSEGWLISRLGQWRLNIGMRSDYEKVTSFQSEREKQIFQFLIQLSKLPYMDAIKLKVSGEQPKEGLTEWQDGELVICNYGELWNKYGEIALACWWDELVEKKEDTEIWFLCWEILQHCWSPDRYMKHVTEFYEVCLESLEKEKDECTWDVIERILRRKIYVERESARQKKFEEILEFPGNRLEWKRQYRHMTDTFWYLCEPYDLIARRYYVCVGQYQTVDRSLRRRFIKCINIPSMSVSHMFGDSAPELLADCLEVADTFLFSAEKIWNMAQDFLTNNTYLKESIEKEIDSCLFGILENGLEWSTEEKWQEVLAQVTDFLFTESFYGNKSKTRSADYMSDVCEDYLIWYKDVVLSMKKRNSMLLDYLEGEFNKNRGMTATRYFKMFITMAGLEQVDTKDDSERILNVYSEFASRILKEDMSVSQISWSFWQNDAWYTMFHSIADSEAMLDRFLKLLPLEQYGNAVDEWKSQSPVLSIGSMALIHLYLTGNLLYSLKDELSPKRKERIERFFIDYFWGIQKEGCNPFDVEAIRLLEAELVVKRCFECVSLFDKEHERIFVERMLKESPERLALFIRYIDKDAVRRQICEQLGQKKAEDFTKNICFIQTQQKLIENMLQICFRNQEDKEFLLKTESVFEELRMAIHEKGKRIEKQYSEWLLAVWCQIEILKGEEEKVLLSGSLFYQAYIYLNRNDMDSLLKSEKIYEEIFQEQKVKGAYINQYCACVRICTSSECSEEKREEYLAKAKRIEGDIEEKCELDMEEKKILYENRFFLYMSLDNMPEVLKTYATLPNELRYEYVCAQYIVKMFANNGDRQRAEEYLRLLADRYGESEEIKRLRVEIAEIGNAKRTLERPADILHSDYSIEALQNALFRIRRLQDPECAELRIEATHEAHLLYMVLDVARLMEQYSGLFKYDGEIAGENTYNKLFQILFNQKNQEIYDFYTEDQTQEGTATGTLKNGRESVGSLDNAIYHGSRVVGIMEGLILRSCDKTSIELHVRKIEGYNPMHVSTAFILIYADTDNPDELWKGYKEALCNISYSGQWEMVEMVEKDVIEAEILNNDVLKSDCRYICMTRHRCRTTGDEIHKYHILLDFKKAADVEEAKKARKKQGEDSK